MGRAAIACLSALAIVGFGAACGGGGGSTSASPPVASATPTPAPTPTPTSTPTPTPTATPIPSVVVTSPTVLAFEAISATATVTVSEPLYSGTFAESDTCAPNGVSIVTVTPSTPSNQFSVTADAAGICTLTFADAHGNTAHVPVSVTLTSLTGQSSKRR